VIDWAAVVLSVELALATLAVLRYGGASAGAAAVYGDGDHPLAQLERCARSVHQESMRSEGDGHLSPAIMLAPALLDAWRWWRPGHPVLAWVSRGAKVGAVALTVAAGRE